MSPVARKTKKRRVLLLCHEDLVPPESVEGLSPKEVAPFTTEWDVYATLHNLGHEIVKVGVHDSLTPVREAIDEHRPDLVFNLLEAFRGDVLYRAHVAAYLELLGVPYTGCNPRGLVIAKDKALSKKVVSYHRIRCPGFAVFQRHRAIRRPKSLEFPLIVKSIVHEGSVGIAQASVVHDDDALVERVGFIHRTLNVDAIVEQFVSGRELYSGVYGLDRLTVLPTWELHLEGLPEGAHRIASEKVKWDLDYQKRHEIELSRAQGLDEEIERSVRRAARRICRALGLDGYVRIDLRLDERGDVWFLEANPNPDIADGDEFAAAALAAGIDYEHLITRVMDLALRRANQR